MNWTALLKTIGTMIGIGLVIVTLFYLFVAFPFLMGVVLFGFLAGVFLAMIGATIYEIFDNDAE